MGKINTLNKDDLLRAINNPLASPSSSIAGRGGSFIGGDVSTIDEALKRLARAGEDYPSMREYAKALIRKFDTNMDGIISFQELCDGLKSYDIILSLKDRIELMKKLDINKDGEISDYELHKALASVESKLSRETVELTLKKIARGADEYQSMKDYAANLIN